VQRCNIAMEISHLAAGRRNLARFACEIASTDAGRSRMVDEILRSRR
jgi:hypothetical protein